MQRLISQRKGNKKALWQYLNVDRQLLIGISLIIGFGLLVLASASNGNQSMISRQLGRVLLGFIIMLICARIPPARYRAWIPTIYTIGVFLLVVVLIFGHIGKGAQRWINLGLFRFQPSEFMKLATPMMIAWYLGEKSLPPKKIPLLISWILNLDQMVTLP